MNCLMIAPEPVFRIRGTPFSVRDRCRALSELGHTVDLLTYPFGDDFHFDNVRIHRTRRVPGIRDIKIGFSFAKIPLDGLLFFKAFLALKRGKYDFIHTHEEAGMIGAILGRWFEVPHLYDMHSSLPQQFDNYGTSSVAPVLGFMRWAERFILRRSQAVIAICPHLKDIALEAVSTARVEVIENLSQMPTEEPDQAEIRQFRVAHGLEDAFVVGYTGTFEVNQGLDILAKAFARFAPEAEKPVLLLAGGEPDQIHTIRKLVQDLEIEKNVRLTGKLPREDMGTVMSACDILASPRIIGTNTPLKLYSYLRSGVPILATDLLTHTQVLDEEIAVLVEPTEDGLLDGLRSLYKNPQLRQTLGASARKRENECYSYPVYKKKLAHVLTLTVPEQEVQQ
jgi:glycosyltransferase involved in cell wall biosynthesis